MRGGKIIDTNLTFTFTTVDGWSCEKFHGVIPGYACGYNFEVTDRNGRTDFMSCQFEYGTPAEVAMSEFEQWRMENYGFTYTGRVAFRGYYEEHYDFEERDSYYTKVERPIGEYTPIVVD